MTQIPGPSPEKREEEVPEGIEVFIPEPRKGIARPWVQVVLIVGLLGAAVWVFLDGWRLWALALAVAGVAFGGAFLLRRMVGDEYGRS